MHEAGLAASSIARHIVALRMFFRYLQLEGALKDNLAELLGSQKLWQRGPEVLSPRQVDEFLRAPHSNCTVTAAFPEGELLSSPGQESSSSSERVRHPGKNKTRT